MIAILYRYYVKVYFEYKAKIVFSETAVLAHNEKTAHVLAKDNFSTFQVVKSEIAKKEEY